MDDLYRPSQTRHSVDEHYATELSPIATWHRVTREAVSCSHQRAPEGITLWVPQTSFEMQVHGFAPFVANPCSLILLHPRFRFDRRVLHDDWLQADEVRAPINLIERGTLSDNGAGEALTLPWMHLDAEAYVNLRRALALPSPLKESALQRWIATVLQLARIEWRKRPLPRQSIIEQSGHPSRFALAQAIAQRLDQAEARGGGLDDLAEHFGVSSFHLLRVFRRVMGTTPHQYFLQLRLRRALLQIDQGRERIVDIALAAGFSSHGHFSTAFRKAFGCSPLEFQRGQQKLAGNRR